ncbi:hypothetical protein [Rhodococcus qingshengii]|uniref:hypothetical protein n=1 Tax=Rhodococcus qingshengii TaxID=334542 RepID=UPI000815D699|nr:hypothetical protein [Rhodococcus qingshengii]SCC65310.1 hypothetical protein GA0061093_11924 [Rhodococcus qingshengii]
MDATGTTTPSRGLLESWVVEHGVDAAVRNNLRDCRSSAKMVAKCGTSSFVPWSSGWPQSRLPRILECGS